MLTPKFFLLGNLKLPSVLYLFTAESPILRACYTTLINVHFLFWNGARGGCAVCLQVKIMGEGKNTKNAL